MNSYFLKFILAFLTISALGCSKSNMPTDKEVISAIAIEKKDVLVAANCVTYLNFKRLNGYESGSEYVVEYSIEKKHLKSRNDCSDNAYKNLGSDPLQATRLQLDITTALVIFGMEEETSTLKDKIRMFKTEKGWIENL